jgi:ParB-like chromosome segregation protein Spo0J
MNIRNGKDLEIDPLATLFPPMSEEAFARLKADICTHGQLEPIWTHRGRVVDGRHRLRACRELGLEPVVRAYDGDGPVLDFVIAKNLHRRHLSGNQRALVAAKLANLPGGRPSRTARKQAVTQTDAAALLQVGRTTVQGARQVLGRGLPELVEAVARDQVKVSTAAEVASLDDAELAELVARGPRAIRERAAQLRRAKQNDPHDGPAPEDEARTTRPAPGPAGAVGDDPILREWLEGLPLWDQLTDRSTFIREAMVWKRVQPLLDQVRLVFPGLDAESRVMSIEPHSTQLVGHLLNLRPPEEWEVCFRCTGTGTSNDPRDPRCSWCRGDGFEITKRGWGDPSTT